MIKPEQLEDLLRYRMEQEKALLFHQAALCLIQFFF